MRHLRTWAFALACAIFVMLAATASAAVVESPHATVAGKTLQQWSAEWWQKTFSLPVYAADGKTITHPQFDTPINPGDVVDAKHGLPSDDGSVFFLFGSFFGGDIDRTVTVPAGKPIFVPIINDEWSNPDTAAKPDFKTLPGNFTPAELAAFAKTQTDTITDVNASFDGAAIPDMLSHRETSPAFQWTAPPEHSIIKTFFGNDVSGPQDAAADGYYLMLTPPEPGEHTLTFSGSSPDNSATPPLLGAFTVNTTYHLNVEGATAIPLPAGAWAGLSVLPLAMLPVLRGARRRTNR